MAQSVDTSKIFQRASEAHDKGNYDYAIALFFDILSVSPDDVKTRMALRTTEKAKFEREGHGKGAAVSAFLAGLPNLIAGWLSFTLKKYDSAIAHYEKCLVRYPFSGNVLWLLANAFEASKRTESVIVTLEFLRQNKPTHIKVLRRLAHLYEERKDIQRAMQRYHMILQNRPHDIEASKKMHDLAATESIQEGWDKGEGFQEKIRDRDKTVRLEMSQKVVRTADEATDAITYLKRELEEASDKPLLWAELGDLERKRDDFKAAAEAYRKALELDPLNQLFVQKLMDTQLQDFDARIAQARKASGAAPSDDPLAARVPVLEKERQEFWLAELRRRVDERPTDMALRFSLGNIYYQIGRTNEATAEFQRVVRDIKYRAQATAMIGKCFAAKGLDELAIEQFERALQEANPMEEFGKDLGYNLGILYEKVGNYEAAEKSYKRVFEMDIGYRDIAEKMEMVYKKRREKNTLPKEDRPR